MHHSCKERKSYFNYLLLEHLSYEVISGESAKILLTEYENLIDRMSESVAEYAVHQDEILEAPCPSFDSDAKDIHVYIGYYEKRVAVLSTNRNIDNWYISCEFNSYDVWL